MIVAVTKENWPEVKADLEQGVTRISVSDDGKTVRVSSESYNGYNFPVKFIQKLLEKGELPEAVLSLLPRRL